MTPKFKSVLTGASLIFAILACTMPLEQFPPPSDMQTAAAQTLQAILTPSLTAAASTPSLTTTSSPRVTRTASTITGSSTTTMTPTYSVPMLIVRESTNCRTGPGEEYDVVVTYTTGRELEIVGRYDPGDFWLVRSNESPSGTCWLWGGFVETTGSYWTVASVTPPATFTSAPPQAPVILEWNFFCTTDLNFTVTWRDNTTDETGFRILRNGEAIAELPPNSTTYTDVYDVPAEQSVEYYLQVYSPTGTANASLVPRMRCGG